MNFAVLFLEWKAPYHFTIGQVLDIMWNSTDSEINEFHWK